MSDNDNEVDGPDNVVSIVGRKPRSRVEQLEDRQSRETRRRKTREHEERRSKNQKVLQQMGLGGKK